MEENLRINREEDIDMVLVLNFFLNDSFAATFDRVIASHFSTTEKECIFIRVDADTKAEDVLKTAEDCTHLLLSGSEASTLDDLGWEEEMKQVVLHYIEAGKPVLGICYGHQFLVRCLVGKSHLRKAPRPEMGWGALSLETNPLSEGIHQPVCLLAHYDEVVNLPSAFRVLGSTEKCQIHGFQYRDLPVWGVQFHPEYDTESGRDIIEELEAEDPDFLLHYQDDRQGEDSRLAQNQLFFRNFARIPPVSR